MKVTVDAGKQALAEQTLAALGQGPQEDSRQASPRPVHLRPLTHGGASQVSPWGERSVPFQFNVFGIFCFFNCLFMLNESSFLFLSDFKPSFDAKERNSSSVISIANIFFLNFPFYF